MSGSAIVRLGRTRLLWRALAFAGLGAIVLLAGGCASLPLPALPVAAPPPADQPAPTVNPMFAPKAPPMEATPNASPTEALNYAQVLRRQLVGPTPVATSRPAQKIVEAPVFDDRLNSNWSTANSIGVQSFFTDTERAYTGSVGISVTPQQDFGRLFFTVKQNTRETYDLERVAGVSVWINSGKEPLDPNNLSITVVGSNDYIYWREDDDSVETSETHFFSESRLYYLGVKNTVPPNTWVEAVVWLDKLPYEPDYKYVTGIYIKNDEWFRRTFYVDQVNLLMVEQAGS
jgi:hypothetical protein